MAKQVDLPENTPDAVRTEAETIEQRIADFKAGQRPAPDGTEVQPAAAPTPEPAVTQDDVHAQLDAKKAELEAKVSDLQHQFDTGVGRYGGTISKLNAKIAELEQTLATLKAQPSVETQPTPPQGSEKPWLNGVSAEDLDRYGEPYYQQEWERVLRIVQTRIPRQDDSQRLQKLEQRLRSERFMNRVEAKVSGANEINGDPVTGHGCDPDWPAYLDQPLHEGGVTTRRQEAESAFDAENVNAFSAIVKAFIDSKRKDKTAPAVKDLRAEVVPASVRGHVPPQLTDTKQRISKSEIDAFTEKMSNPNTHKMTIAEVEAKLAEYRQAYQEGRVDTNR